MTQLPSGRTRVLGIVGDPVVQVGAPAIWTALFRDQGLDAVCVPAHVRPEDLAQFLAGAARWQNLDGLIVTIPHKITAATLATELSTRADRVGAVNVLRPDGASGWTGDILDGVGLVAALTSDGRPLRDRRALVVGSGGVGTAVAHALGESGVADLAVSDLDPARALTLARRLTQLGYPAHVAEPVAAGFDVVVNCSPAGMRAEDDLPIDLDGTGPGTTVADAVAHPPVTRLLRLARERGCWVVPGGRMMHAQVPDQAEFFGYGRLHTPDRG
ncbi:shikimate dehydrogenase family protein [Pseudonocardia lutea]|uniref:Shikimate dehydrogenase family protein n=1 Tax=Pseudonocardia lutea TaxID=2172015 RepID=A0ABW1I518_9PSEU